ncbi:MAG: substrate-binding domain-containing protein [Roseibium sp.]|uniref:LacI family DNA-binding transcriptional regulator n=1 Tax=Roseibium sp. TaxID=1936156 RepID=UPI002627D909|nr:substrate-binding domain-containing protein [Roseibium sp.]MCV0427933.1 substrate-binding domain-containing protein [Roseibium sp.]
MENPSGTKKLGVRALAKMTGFSTGTISRVLNNSALVNAETRRQVLEAIDKAGYTRNPAARALATQRTKTIGAVVPTLAHSIFARFLNAIEQELAGRGYALVIATSGEDADTEERRARELIDLGAEGVILSGAVHNVSLLEFLSAGKIPVICTSVCKGQNGLPAIGYDNAALGQKALRFLVSLGHKNLLVLHGPKQNNDRTRLRIEGVMTGASETGAKVQLLETTLDVAGGTKSAADYFSSKHPGASAVLCLSDVLALGVLFEAGRRGISVPGDLSLMGFDDLDWAAHSVPSLTTIRLPTARMGTHVAKALMGKLDSAEPIETLRLDAEIVQRESVADVKT